jgi:hypothetical protein
LRTRESHVKDAHSGLAMQIIDVRDVVLGESLRWWSDCITHNSKYQKEQHGLQYDVDKGYRKESTTGHLKDFYHHDGEGEHHNDMRGWGGHSGKRELEGGSKILAP